VLSATTGGSAQRFIHIECYIFQKGRVSDRILHALEERARAGVEVRMVIDAVGSTAFPDNRFAALRQAGGRVACTTGCVGIPYRARITGPIAS
jgi:cardiolipin synthase